MKTLNGCPFCDIPLDKRLFENDGAFAFFDRYPVSKGHILIVPKRHFPSFFDADEKELDSIYKLLCAAKDCLVSKYAPDGFNIGVNVGESAGQTIFHLHIHLIPRYKGDMSDPKGGVRGVIPEKQKY